MPPRVALTEPLTTRPDYGDGGAALPRGQDTVAESGLPGTGPSAKGQSLDSDIPGTRTFDKPVNETRDFDKAPPGSIYRKDGPDDLAKPQEHPDEDRRDNEWVQPRYDVPGGRPKGDPTVTKWPYRDDRPHKHYASNPEQVAFVQGLFRLRSSPVLRVLLGGMTRTAARMDDMLEGLNPKVEDRAASCSVKVRRVDTGNLRWIFAVNCGNGAKVVRMKAARQGNVVKVARMDLDVSCSCDGWQWLGPEHHSQEGQYLDGAPRGTASVPVVRDPTSQNKLCKHVAAVLGHIRSWEVPL